jgi:hypothetical protein
MAKIVEELMVIKVSQIVKDGESAAEVLTGDIAATVEQVIAEIVGSGCVVEVVSE